MKVENLDAIRDSKTNAIVFEKQPRLSRKDKYIKSLEKRVLRLTSRLLTMEERLSKLEEKL